MLLELTPEEADSVVPIAPTWVQLKSYWNDAFQSTGRIIVAGLVCLSLLVISNLFVDESFFSLILFLGAVVVAAPYPFLWGPLRTTSQRNLAFRQMPYAGLFFGKVLRTRRLTVLVEEREQIDENGDLYIEEIRERQFELEVGDESGVTYRLRVKDNPQYLSIVRQQSVIGMVKAYSRDLERRPIITEVYVVKLNQWVGDTSYLKREEFLDLASSLLNE